MLKLIEVLRFIPALFTERPVLHVYCPGRRVKISQAWDGEYGRRNVSPQSQFKNMHFYAFMNCKSFVVESN